MHTSKLLFRRSTIDSTKVLAGELEGIEDARECTGYRGRDCSAPYPVAVSGRSSETLGISVLATNEWWNMKHEACVKGPRHVK